MGVKQIIASTYSAPAVASTNYYVNIGQPNTSSSVQWVASEFFATTPWSVAGTFKNLVITIGALIPSGRTLTFTLRKNGVDTALTCVLTDSILTISDLTHSFTIAAGDRIVIKATWSGLSSWTIPRMTVCLEFDGDNAGESGYCSPDAQNNTSVWNTQPDWYYGIGYGQLGSLAARSSSITGAYTAASSPARCWEVITVEGDITRYDILGVSGNAIVNQPAGKSMNFALLKNEVVQDGSGGTVDTRCTMAAGTSTASWTGTLPVSPGDTIRIRFSPINYVAATNVDPCVSWCLKADTDGDFQMGLHSAQLVTPSTATPAKYLAGGSFYGSNWFATESATLIREAIIGPTPFWINDIRFSRASDAPSSTIFSFGIQVNRSAYAIFENGVDTVTSAGNPAYSIWLACSSVSGAGSVPANAGFSWTVQDAPIGPPAPDASWPCNIGKPIFWGVTTDINNNPYLFSQKMCRDAATYYGGYKPHRLLEVSEISRVASDFANGGWTANTARARIADPDRLFRSITAQPSLINRTAWLYAYSEAIRAVQGNPTLLFHGKIYNDPFAYNLTYELNINDYIGSQYGVLRDDLMIPQRTVGTDDFPNRPNASDGLGIPIIGGTHSKMDGAIKVYSVGTRTVGGTSYVMAMVAGHACAGGITQAYDSSGATLNWGTDAFAPGQASWTTIQPGGQLYYDINGNRYTLIFIVASSGLGVDFISGATSIYVNTSGMEATGTGSGAVILDLLTLYKYLMVQWFTQSYLGGAWLPGLTFEFFPGMGVSYDVVNEDSFDAASVQSAVYLGGGFVGGFVIGAGGTRVSIRQMLQICNTSCNVWMGVDAQSRIFVNMFNTDRATFLGSARTITDRRDIVKPGLSITPKYEWFANQLAYQYNENYRQDGRGRWDGFNIQGNAPSIDKYGAVRGTRTYGLINDTATADEVGQQQLTFGGIDPPRIVTWPQSLCGMQNDILSGVPITDFNGMYAPGWVDNAVYIIGQKLTPRNCTVTFTGVDAQALVS